MKKNIIFGLIIITACLTAGCTVGTTNSPSKNQAMDIGDYQAKLQRQQINPNSETTSSLPAVVSVSEPFQAGDSSTSPAITTTLATSTNPCTQKPVDTKVGGLVYPVDVRYSRLQYLGQMFTAYRCGEKRLKEVQGNDLKYTIGSIVELRNDPAVDFQKTLKEVGYRCYNKIIDAKCRKWILDKDVDISSLIRIEPFATEIYQDDCINCG